MCNMVNLEDTKLSPGRQSQASTQMVCFTRSAQIQKCTQTESYEVPSGLGETKKRQCIWVSFKGVKCISKFRLWGYNSEYIKY